MSVETFERELLRKAAAGESAAVDAFVGHYEQRVYTLVQHLCGAQEQASTILGEVFVRVIRQARTFADAPSISAEVFRVAVASTVAFLSTDSPREGAQERSDTGITFSSAVQRLPFEFKLVLLLHDMLRLSIEECQRVLSLGTEECQARLQRARHMLRRSLSTSTGMVGAVHNDAQDQPPIREVVL